MMAGWSGKDEANEDDVCPACNKITTMMVWFRVQDALMGLCDDCITDLGKGLNQMRVDRGRWLARNRE
jgi:hypothetical protein